MPQSTAGRVLLSMTAAICVTLITNALDTTPTVSLIGATLAAAVPALITAGGPYGLTLGLGVTAAALGVTYLGFTAVDVTTDRPLTFPVSERAQERLGVTTASSDTSGDETESTPTTTAEEPVADPEAGKVVFDSNGCGSCHTFSAAGATGTVGPNLDESPGGKDPEYIRSSIVDPSAEAAEGYEPGVMPTYDTLSDVDLKNLIAFLTQS